MCSISRIFSKYHLTTPLIGDVGYIASCSELEETNFVPAGFYPTTVSYLSLFYTRYEFGRRLGLFYGQYAVAGALGGILSYVVFSAFPSDDNAQSGHLARQNRAEAGTNVGWKPWQMLFLLEGGLTILIALLGICWLPRSAGSAWFLRGDEREWAERRVAEDRQAAELAAMSKDGGLPQTLAEDDSGLQDGLSYEDDVDEGQHRQLLSAPSGSHDVSDRAHMTASSVVTSDRGLSRRDILEAISDWKIWYLLVINICSSVPAMAFSVFLPLVVKGLGVDSTRANLLTAPPFITGAIMLWTFAWWSDRKKERLIPILWGLAINLLGLTGTVMLAEDAYSARYVSLCILLGGSFIASPLTVAWLAGNIEEPGKRAIVLGINGWGNLAGLLSALLFSPRHAPHYIIPFYVTFAMVLFSFVGYLVFRALLLWENKVRVRMVSSWTSEEIKQESQWGTGPFRRRRGMLDALGMPGVADRVDQWMAELNGGEQFRDGNGRRGDDKITFIYGL